MDFEDGNSNLYPTGTLVRPSWTTTAGCPVSIVAERIGRVMVKLGINQTEK